jgi:hypothetical protein
LLASCGTIDCSFAAGTLLRNDVIASASEAIQNHEEPEDIVAEGRALRLAMTGERILLHTRCCIPRMLRSAPFSGAVRC